MQVELTSDPGNHDGIKKALAAGFFYHTASLQKTGTYRTVKSPQTVHIHPSSGLQEVCTPAGAVHALQLRAVHSLNCLRGAGAA